MNHTNHTNCETVEAKSGAGGSEDACGAWADCKGLTACRSALGRLLTNGPGHDFPR